MQVRIRFIAVLAILLVSVSAVLGVMSYRHHADQANLAKAQALATAVTRPAGAASSTDCISNGLTACWITQESSKEAATAAEAQLRSSHVSPDMTCSVPSHAPAGVSELESCVVVVHFGDRTTIIDAHANLAVVNGSLKRAGTLVMVSAS